MSKRHGPGVIVIAIYRFGRVGQKNAVALKEMGSNEEPSAGRTPILIRLPDHTYPVRETLYAMVDTRPTNPQSYRVDPSKLLPSLKIRVDEPLTFLIRVETKQSILPQLMAFPCQHYNAREQTYGQECRDAKNPAYTYRGNPRVNKKRDSEAKDETIEAHNACCLGRMVDETFAYVVGGCGYECHGADSDEECSQCEHHVVQLVFERCSEDPETNGQQQ